MIIDMMQEARNHYPIGTKFKSTFENDINIVRDLNFEFLPQVSVYREIIQNSDGGWIYQSGKWAEIIELGQQPEYQPLIFN